MTKQDIERIRDRAEAGKIFLLTAPEIATLCRIALIAIAAREATREEVERP